MRVTAQLVLALLFAMLSAGSIAQEDQPAPPFRGDQGLEPILLKNLDRNLDVNLQSSTFNVSISRNGSPRDGYDCDRGDDPINRYPFAIEGGPGARISGGLFRGNLSLESDWEWTYCNSAGIRVENTPEVRFSSQRMDRLWDAYRIGKGSQDFEISGAWVTNNRDDCVENDRLMSGKIMNSLFDGCFVGISLAPRGRPNRRAAIELDSVFLRLEGFNYKGDIRHGLPFKLRGNPPKLKISNSVFAAEQSDIIGLRRAETLWGSIERCSNNLFLWLGPGDPPAVFGLLPECFEVVSGPRAEAVWARVRENWINCNGRMDRFATDPTPLRSRCVSNILSEF